MSKLYGDVTEIDCVILRHFETNNFFFIVFQGEQDEVYLSLKCSNFFFRMLFGHSAPFISHYSTQSLSPLCISCVSICPMKNLETKLQYSHVQK